MKLSKQRKVYVAILGLAAVAFLTDRVLLQPAGAGASPPVKVAEAVAASAGSAEGAAAPVAGRAPVEGPSLATKLSRERSGAMPERDPFRRSWTGVTSAKSTQAAGGENSTPPATAKEFAAKYELRAVSRLNNDMAVAMIGKASCKQGEAVDGWTLVSIDDRSAILERGDQRVTLVLRGMQRVDNSVVPRRPGEESGKIHSGAEPRD